MPGRPLTTRYQQDLALFPDRGHKFGLLVALLVVFIFPFYASNHWLVTGNMALIAIVGSVAMMILTGFAGQISLGHAAFLGVGAYTTAGLALAYHLPFWVAVPLGGVAAALLGLLVGPFALRLKGLYLAIVTVGLVFLVQHIIQRSEIILTESAGTEALAWIWFGSGNEGKVLEDFTSRKPLDLGFAQLEFDQLLFFYFLLLAGFAAWVGKNLARSNTGRSMMAVRDHDLAAAVLGVHPARTKVIAFGISSFLAGICGGMFALQQTQLSVDNFNLYMSVDYIAMIVLGGVGTIFGAVAGALAFVMMEPLAHHLGAVIPYVSDWTDKMQSSFFFAVLVCGFLVFEPLGVLGIWLRIKRYFMGWPFRY